MNSNKTSTRNTSRMSHIPGSKRLQALVCGMLLALYSGTAALADDTEIYDGTGSSYVAPPLVMFTIDFQPQVISSTYNCTSATCTALISGGYLASSSTTRFGILVASLKYVLNSVKDVKIGLMMSHNAQTNCASPSETSQCSGGGFIMMGFTPVTDAAWNVDAGKAKFFGLLDKLQAESDTVASSTGPAALEAHPFQGAEVFFEFFRYITGNDAYSSHLGWTDFGTDNTYNLSNAADKPDFMRDYSIEGITFNGSAVQNNNNYNSPGTYTSPITEDCQKIFTVNFLQGVTNQDADADSAIATNNPTYNANNRSGYMTNITYSGSNKNLQTILTYLHGTDFGVGQSENPWGKDVNHGPNWDNSGAALMGNQNVTSYFIVDNSGLATGNKWAAAGGSTAAVSWSSDPDDVIANLKSVLYQIISTSTTFTAASVPVSVLNRAQIVDNVFIALFKADPDGKPTWPGNVKRLRLDTTDGLLKDANDVNAVSGVDGRILHSALTFWTDDTTLPAADPNLNEIDGKDGRSVARGGAGQIIPGFVSGSIGTVNTTDFTDGNRKVYYEPASGTTVSDLNADSTTGADTMSDFNVATSAEAETLIKYVRGQDTTVATTTPRSWIMGDPLHSRPLPINYGTTVVNGTPDIRLVFGTNDGLFHMVQNSNGSTALGQEDWAFMPRATMGMVNTLKTNSSASSHPYGVDGAPSVYTIDVGNDGVLNHNDGDKVYVYFGLRRGGRAYYSLDLSNPNTKPVYQWAIKNTDTDFTELGYSFSQARVGFMNWGSGRRAVIIFSGGYDPSTYDTMGNGNATMGNALYIVDAVDGTLVWKATKGTATATTTNYQTASMVDSIPSTPATLDTDGDTLIDRAYVGDTGGRVWRFDFAGTDRTTWKATVLASVGRRDYVARGGSNSSSTSYLNDRRFFHRPDFIQYKDATGDYDAVVIASGDRASPKTDLKAVNYLYVIKDRNTSSGTTSASSFNHDSFYDVTDNCIQNSSCTGTPDLTNGWRLKFGEVGEKSLATPTTLAKKIFVTTYLPEGGVSSGDCTPKEGSGRLYAISLEDGTAVNNYYVGNGDTLSTQDRYTDLASGGIPAEVVYVPFNRILKPDLSIEEVGISGRWKTYWYKKEN